MHLLYAVYAHLSSPSSQFPHPCESPPPTSAPISSIFSITVISPLPALRYAAPPPIKGQPALRSCTCIVDLYSSQAFLHRPPLSLTPSPSSFFTSPFHLDGDIRIASRIPRNFLEKPRFPPRSSESTSFIDSWHRSADQKSPHARVGEDEDEEKKRGKAVLDLLYKSRELAQSCSSHHSLT